MIWFERKCEEFEERWGTRYKNLKSIKIFEIWFDLKEDEEFNEKWNEFIHSLKFRGKDPKEDEELDTKIEKDIRNFDDLISKKIRNSI